MRDNYNLCIPDTVMVCQFLTTEEKVVIGYILSGFERMGRIEKRSTELHYISKVLGIRKPVVSTALKKAKSLGLTPYPIPVWRTLGSLYARAFISEKEHGSSFDPDDTSEKRFQDAFSEFISIVFDTDTLNGVEFTEICKNHVHLLQESLESVFGLVVNDLNREFNHDQID